MFETRALPIPHLPKLLPHVLHQLALRRLTAIRIPAFTMPAALARIIAHLPQQPPTLALTTLLNAALGRVLPRDALEPLTGRHLCLRVTDAGLSLDFSLGESGFQHASPRAKPDLVLAACARDYLALALREEDADSLFFSRRLIMEGDTELGLLVKNTLDAVDWDALLGRADDSTQA